MNGLLHFNAFVGRSGHGEAWESASNRHPLGRDCDKEALVAGPGGFL